MLGPFGWPLVQSLDFLRSADAHIMGRTAYEGMAVNLPAHPDHPVGDILNAGHTVVFSRTMKTADWANTAIAAGDTAEEIDKLRRGGDGHIVVWGVLASGGRSCNST
ncbi:MAG TPA: hypothetical protein VGH53_25340 [Streptosporangiaceae bacterium]